MRNIPRLFLTAFQACVFVLQAKSASASGREGAALVEPVLWILIITLGTFAALVFGGGLRGALRARQSGESILKGSARGLLRGLFTFLIVSAVSFVGLNILGLLWIAYSFLSVYVLSPS